MASRTVEPFSIDATIVNAEQLLDLAQTSVRDASKVFTAIAGLESIRGRQIDLHSSGKPSSRSQLLDFLAANETTSDLSLFDLTIVDEARYLRNPETASHETGRTLSAASEHLLFLTATSIQIKAENLFNLIKLIDPERFSDVFAFDRIRQANTLVTRALNALRRNPFNAAQFAVAMKEITKDRFFASDPFVEPWRAALPSVERHDDRVRVGRLLEERSLLASVFSRTRKRDVFLNRVIREPVIRKVRLSNAERVIYDEFTNAFRQQARGANSANALALITRQRKLTSSIPAALSA